MYILLASATSFEIQPTLDALEARRMAPAGQTAGRTAGPALVPGKQDLGFKWDRLITGVGMLATTWSLMRQIDRRRPDLIIQAGIAGSFMPQRPGETWVVRDESLGDLGVWEEERFQSPFDLGLADPNQHPFAEGRLVNPYSGLIALTGLRPASAVTVNEITTDPARIAWFRRPSQQKEPPAVESMEGGALHYIGIREEIPFLQIRAVSNEVGVRDKSKWDMKAAIQVLNECLLSLLDKLGKMGPQSLNQALYVPDSK